MSLNESSDKSGESPAIEFTEREKAIARGEDPDSVGQEQSADAVGERVEESEPVQDADATGSGDGSRDGGGKDAAGADDWRKDVAELAEKHGISDEELGAFHSADQFRLFTRLVEKQKPAEGADPDGAGGDVSGEVPDGEIPDLDVQTYIDNEYSEETINIVKYAKAMKERLDKIEPEFHRMRSGYEQEIQRRRVEEFHDAVDGLDADLFGRSVTTDGKAVKLSEEHDARRQKVWAAAADLAETLQKSGRPAPPMKELVRRAADLEFRSELQKIEQRRAADRLRKQAGRVRQVAGGTRSRQAPAPKSEDDLVNHPELVTLWKKFQDENGAD